MAAARFSYRVFGAVGALALASLAGCGAILGFQDAAPNGKCAGPLDCAPDQSCVAGLCAQRCSSNAECDAGQACQSPADAGPATCSSPMAAMVNADASEDGEKGADAGADADAGGADADADEDADAECPSGFADCNGQTSDGCETNLLFDPSNCQVCGRVCTNAPCAAGLCRSQLHVGYPDQGTFFVSILPNVIYAWHLPAVTDGTWLWKVGILISPQTPGVAFALGVYQDDGSGHPGTLVAQGALVSGMGPNGPTGSANEFVVPSPLPALHAATPYYVAVLAAESAMDAGLVLTTNAGPAVPVFQTEYPFGTLPPMVTLPQSGTSNQADVYIVVAE